jgi:hypothetical protein
MQQHNKSVIGPTPSGLPHGMHPAMTTQDVQHSKHATAALQQHRA